MATKKELQEKYKDRINPSKKDQEDKGIVPLTKFEQALIDQGVDPEDAAPTAPDTLRDGVTQFDEVEKKGNNKKEANKAETKEVVAEKEGESKTERKPKGK